MAIGKQKQLEQLEQECRERGLKLMYDDLRTEGGLCRLRDSYYVILNRRLAAETRCRILTDALARVGELEQARAAAPGPVPAAPTEKAAEPSLSPETVNAQEAIAAPRPEPEFDEPEFGVPVSTGVPDSQS